MDKKKLILKYFQRADQLTVKNKEYQKTISFLFKWLTENDRVNNDRTSEFFPNISCTAKIIAKEEGITAGVEEVKFSIKTFTSLSFRSLINDGSKFKNNDVIAEIKGRSHDILGYERTILNILQRMSGIAAETNRMIKSLKTPRGWPASKVYPVRNSPGVEETEPIQHFPYLAATRKTPWMMLDKKAVAVGGGLTHRLNLSDGILIKDNHLTMIKKAFHFKTDEEDIEKAIKSIIGKGNTEAIKTPRGWPASKVYPVRNSPGVEELERELIEIEVTNQQQAHIVIKIFQQFNHNNHLAILLDNFSPSQTKSLLSNLSDLYDLTQIIFEASGGIDEKNIKDWSKTGVDILSIGNLTHSVRAINLSLEFSS